MIYSQQQSLSDKVIQTLSSRSYRAVELLNALQQEGLILSRQALYDILRKLAKAEVVVKNGKSYSLNLMWADTVVRKLEILSGGIEDPSIKYLHNMEDGSSIAFRFKSPADADKFWGHEFMALQSVQPKTVPLATYFPHPWLYYARPETEKEFFKIIDRAHPVYYLVGGNTNLDKLFRKKIQSKNIKVNLSSKMGQLSNRHITVQGDYITELIVEKKFMDAIDKIFAEEGFESTRNELAKLGESQFKTKLRVRRDRKLANKMRKQMTKDFHVPKTQRLEM